MINNVTFGAAFMVELGSSEENKRIEKEGLNSKKVKKLSKELNSITPKNYKILLVDRDNDLKRDTFVLRKKDNDNWHTVSSCQTKQFSGDALNINRLADIFEFLKLKAKHELQIKNHNEKLKTLIEQQREELIQYSDLIG